MRRSSRIIATLGALAVFFAFGGLDGIRWARARWKAWLQPPTVEQFQRAAPEPQPLRASLPAEAVHGKMWLSDPPRPVAVAIVLGSIVSSTLAAMYFTGRTSRT